MCGTSSPADRSFAQIEQEQMRQKLIVFYREYNPSKIAGCDTGSGSGPQHLLDVVRWYFNRQDALNERLRDIYGAGLTSAGPFEERTSSNFDF